MDKLEINTAVGNLTVTFYYERFWQEPGIVPVDARLSKNETSAKASDNRQANQRKTANDQRYMKRMLSAFSLHATGRCEP